MAEKYDAQKDEYVTLRLPKKYIGRLSIYALVLLGRIAPLTKYGKETCFLSDTTITEQTGLKKTTIYSALRDLVDENCISISKIRKGQIVLRQIKYTGQDPESMADELRDTNSEKRTPSDELTDSATRTNELRNTNLASSPDELPIYKDIDRSLDRRIDRNIDDSSFSDFPKSYFLKNCSLSELADICQKYQDDCYKVLAKSLLVDHEFYWPEKDRDCKFERDGSDLEQVIAKDINPLTYLLLEQKYPESEVSKPIVEKIGAAWNDTGTNHIKTFFDGWLAKEVKGLEFAHRADFKGEVFERVNQYIADNVSPMFYGHPVTVYRDSIDKVPEIYTLKGNIQYLRYVVNAYMYIAYNCNPIRYEFGNADDFYAKRTKENMDAIKTICREDFGRELSLDEIR